MGNVAVYKKGTTDFFSQGLGLLSDVVSSTLTQTVSSTGNVEQKLEVEYPIDGYLVSELVEGAILRVSVSTDKSDYGVFEIVDTLNDDSGTITVYGDPYYNRILRMSFDNGGVFTKFSNVQSALNVAKQNITGFPADFNLTSNLSTSVDLSENTYDTFGTFLEALNSAVHGNIKYSLNSIQIYSAIGKDITDITLRDDMNTSSVKITTDFSGIINKVIPVLPILDKDGNATDKTKVGTIVISKYSNQFLDYWAGKVIQFDTQNLANTYFDKTKADRPVQTVDVDPIGLDDDFSTINIFDTIELYSTRLDYTDKLRVSERVFDTLSENVISFKLGSSSVNIFNKINEQNNEIFNNVVKLTNAAISANGKGIDYFGQAKPSSPKEGDTWFWDDGTDFGIKQYTNGEWVDLAGSNTAEKIATAVDDAVTQANAYSDQLVADNVAQVNRTLSDVQSKQADLSAQQAELDTKAQGYANKALADAKANTLATATQTAKDASDALAKAKTDLTTSLNKEVTDRQKAITDLDAKSTGAINQAKNDAQSALDALQVGGRNLFLGTSDYSDPANDKRWTLGGVQSITDDGVNGLKSANTIWQWGGPKYNIVTLENRGLVNITDTYTASVWVKNTSPTAVTVTMYADAVTYIGNRSYSIPANSDWTRIRGTFKFTKQTGNTNGIRFEPIVGISGGVIKQSGLKLEMGNKATDYTQAPEDIVLDYTTKDNIIRQSLTQYQSTNDGKVTKAQSDATQALGLVATKVSQTTFDTKTGDLDSKYTAVKQTADQASTDIVAIKSTNTSQDTKINTLTSDVSGTKQSISDIQTEQGKQSTKINTIQTDISGTKQDISDIKDANGVQDGKIASISTTVDGLSSSFSTYKTTNDGKVAKAQADIVVNTNAIATKVSQTAYDAKTGQLQTDLNTTTTTANQAKTDIVAIKSDNTKQDARMTTIESDANGTKTTVSNLQTDLGKVNGSITTLQQRADGFDATVTKVNNLAVGGRNYWSFTNKIDGQLILPSGYITNSASGLTAYNPNYFDIKQGQTVWVTIYNTISTNNATLAGRLVYYDKDKNFISSTSDIAITQGNYKNIAPSNSAYFRISLFKYANIKIKVEVGTLYTDWTPAPEDTDNKISTVSQTVDSIRNIVSDPTTGLTKRVQTAEGSISTVQSNVSDLQSKQTQTASGLTTEISDRQKGDTNTLTQAKDFTTSSISNSESGMRSLITQTSDSIIAKVDTKTDSATVLSLLKDNWSIGITGNTNKLASGIAADQSAMAIVSQKVIIDSPQTQIAGTAWINSAMIGNGQIGTAQIGDAAITSAKIANLDVSKITGNVTNFIQSNWNGEYSSTKITSTGMEIGDLIKNGFDTIFDKTGITFKTTDARYGYAMAHYGTDAITARGGGIAGRGMEIRTGTENGVGFDYFAIKSPGANNLEFGNTTNAGHMSIVVVPDTNLMPIFNKGVTILDDLYVGNVNGAKAGSMFSRLVGRTIYIPTSMNSNGTVGKWQEVTL